MTKFERDEFACFRRTKPSGRFSFSLAPLNLIAQDRQSQIYFVDLQLVGSWVGACEKFFVRVERFGVLLEIIMRDCEKKVRHHYVGSRTRDPLVFGHRAAKIFRFKERKRQVCMRRVFVGGPGKHPPENRDRVCELTTLDECRGITDRELCVIRLKL